MTGLGRPRSRVEKIVEVKAAGGAYPVLCGEDAAGMLARVWQPEWRQAALIGDANTAGLFGPPMCPH